jgi:hypothetical protein
MKHVFIILFGIIFTAESCIVSKSVHGSALNPPKKKSAEWCYQQGVFEAKSTNFYVAIFFLLKP